MTAKELREIAMEIPGVSGVHAMKKDELLAVVKEARGIKDEAPQKKKIVKTAKKVYTVKELKAKIALLKEDKEKAREAKDKTRVEVLRRRINRMKKLTRKVAQA
ncbi:MAG: transcription termination factor Rho [Deltaproteobacteria bacterium]|nr:MAG: transcription termination factor Rho [Deltaproteobacteria bacterium]